MASSPVDIRLLVVADNPFARAGIASLLGAQNNLQIVGQSAADESLSEQVRLYQPDVLVWELPYEPTPGAARLDELDEIGVPTLLLLSDENRAADVLAAGARGVLPQNTDAGTIAAGIVALAAGLLVISPEFRLSLSGGVAAPTAAPEMLTAREMEVLQLVAEGLPNKQIALKLSISEHTVKFHVNAIMGKLGVQSRTEAVVRATRLGLIAL